MINDTGRNDKDKRKRKRKWQVIHEKWAQFAEKTEFSEVYKKCIFISLLIAAAAAS